MWPSDNKMEKAEFLMIFLLGCTGIPIDTGDHIVRVDK